ncbi:IST1-like [Tropilaelaps mercedesae]|uniref:IST1 homolog n=1 Tax=Tropilaelaps mercedesae TaxID=418985 RepID=A0A1V9X2H3_9ACAR|nr:IST1-like [Tropilaelaps mercedesae]
MFTSGPSYDKLKTNLRLSMSRLKLAQKKKAELGQKSRKEIAEYLAMGKADRARIRVEHIIREDYYCEAMEMLEMYCDLILARFGLVKECQTLDSGLQESVSTIIWAGPRVVNDVPEIKIVCDQLGKKYGELYMKGVRDRSIDTVNAKLMHRLSAEPPSRNLVESYLKEIASAHGLTYEPQVVDDGAGNRGDGGVGELIDMGLMKPDPSTAVGFRPDLMDPARAPQPARLAPAFEPPLPETQIPSADTAGGLSAASHVTLYSPPVRPAVPSASDDQQPPLLETASSKADTQFPPYGKDMLPPTYDVATTMVVGRGGTNGFPLDVSDLDLFEIPKFPDVPLSDAGTPQNGNGGTTGTAGRNVDFDELSKRFEELKRRK